jgi:CheY-like chemotaxis protein
MPRSKVILIVEDSDDDYLATMRAFQKAHMANPVQRCTDGDQALDYLYRRGQFAPPAEAPNPSIILLDLNLPGTDGREVLRVIKSDPALNKIPVLVLTISSAKEDIETCYRLGANTYIQKPVDIQKFFDSIARLEEYWFEVAILPKTS